MGIFHRLLSILNAKVEDVALKDDESAREPSRQTHSLDKSLFCYEYISFFGPMLFSFGLPLFITWHWWWMIALGSILELCLLSYSISRIVFVPHVQMTRTRWLILLSQALFLIVGVTFLVLSFIGV